MPKKSNALTVLLLAVILITLYDIYLEHDKYSNQTAHVSAPPASQTKVYIFSGQNQNWKVDHYTVVRMEKTIWRGGAVLTYIGEPGSMPEPTFIQYRFQEEHRGKNETMMSTSRSSSAAGIPAGTAASFTEPNELGSIESPLSTDEQGAYTGPVNPAFIVEWKDSSGAESREVIPLLPSSSSPLTP